MATQDTATPGTAAPGTAARGAAEDGSAEPTSAQSPPAVAQLHDDEGNTPAAWTACGGVMIGTALGALGIVFGSSALLVSAAAVTVGALVAGVTMSRASGRA